MRDREDAGQDGHDELRLRRVRDGGGFWHEARPASRVLRLRGYGRVLRANGQAHGALARIRYDFTSFQSRLSRVGAPSPAELKVS